MLLHDRAAMDRALQVLGEELDIPDYVYEEATLKYEDVAAHLAAEDSALLVHSPQVYPQGSFRLGTVVRPINADDEYDIDLVCQLDIEKDETTQSDLKRSIGDQLKKRADLQRMLLESRRCWRLDYPTNEGAPGFHMDVLPCIPNAERQPNGILLTDTELVRWQNSNPVAYAEWFRSRMAVVFRQKVAAVAESIRASIEEVPEWRVKTPLQRVVQILKRHRDGHFQQNPELRPVSIIITTLAAHAYDNQEDIFDSLTHVVQNLHRYVERRGERWWVQNPVDPEENFADKWNEYPKRREAFMAWLQKVAQDFRGFSAAPTLQDGVYGLGESMGARTMSKVAADLGLSTVPVVANNYGDVPALADISHVQSPPWRLASRYEASVTAGVHQRKNGKKLYPLGKSVPRGAWLSFYARTNVSAPFAVEWQVVNTGRAAATARQLRGDFYGSDSPKTRWEHTAYRGTHWVEAFVIKNGVCVARSGQTLVKVL